MTWMYAGFVSSWIGSTFGEIFAFPDYKWQSVFLRWPVRASVKNFICDMFFLSDMSTAFSFTQKKKNW